MSKLEARLTLCWLRLRNHVLVREFIDSEDGDMVERGLILAAIVVVAVALWFAIGNRLAGRLVVVRDSLR